jgi:L-threonylcarbamoyladenylate synthase
VVSCFKLRQIAKQLHNGAVIAYPTEAVYGLGCDPLDEEAVYRLLALKSRPVKKGLILIAADFEQVAGFVRPLAPKIKDKLEASWPGPVTWLLPASRTVPYWLRGDSERIAVRVSRHPVVRAICNQFGGAIVSTSANPTGKVPARSAFKVKDYFGDELPIIHDQLGGLNSTTPIIDVITGESVRG